MQTAQFLILLIAFSAILEYDEEGQNISSYLSDVYLKGRRVIVGKASGKLKGRRFNRGI
jgi:hypothetical protein